MQTWLNDLSKSASERKTVSIFRWPPLTGITTNESWAWTMSPLRNVWGSHCWNLTFLCEFRLGYLKFNLLYAAVFVPTAQEVLNLIIFRMDIWASSITDRHSTQYATRVDALLESDLLAFLPPLLESDNGSRSQSMENQKIFLQSWSSYPRYFLRIDDQRIHRSHPQLPTHSWMRQSQDLSIRCVDEDT